MGPSQVILVVDDEPALVDVVVYNLRQAGFETVSAADGHEALRLAARVEPALVVLDLLLPGLDGLTVFRILRERSPTLPIIMVTARTSEMDRILGLELGADDYVPKPFSPRELVARIRAVLRRVGGEGPSNQEEAAAVKGTGRTAAATVNLGDGLAMDPLAREVSRGGRPVPLTATEFRLLAAMVDRPGQALSRTLLLDLVWGEEVFGDARVVDVHVRHLREKLEADASHPRLIETVRGFGYRLRLPEPAGGEGA